MILLNSKKLLQWLEVTERSQNWLAKELGLRIRGKPYTKGYISQILNNKCKISTLIIENLLLLTNIPFEELFYFDGKEDKREFYGDEIWDGEKFLPAHEYKRNIFLKIFDKFKNANKIKRFQSKKNT